MAIYRIMGRFVHRLKRLIPLAAMMFAACDDPFGPLPWSAVPDTLLIYSASRGEHIGKASAVDIASSQVGVLLVPIEAPEASGQWDFALTDVEGGLALAPASAFSGLESRARIDTVTNQTLDEVRQASRDTADFSAEPAVLAEGHVYVLRSRRAPCGRTTTGFRYAKLRPIEIDAAAGTFRFEIVRNPYCDNRSFIPPEE